MIAANENDALSNENPDQVNKPAQPGQNENDALSEENLGQQPKPAQPGKEDELYQNDPLLLLLRRKLRLSNTSIILASIILASIILLILPAILVSPDKRLDNFLIDGLRALVESWLIIPVSLALYLWIPGYITRLLNTLKAQEIVGEKYSNQRQGIDYDDFQNSFIRLLNQKWWFVAAVIAVGVYWTYRIFLADTSSLVPVFLVLYSPFIYAGVLTIIRLIILIHFINKLFKVFHMRISPLHPDRSGGISIVGHLLAVTLSVVIVLGICAVISGFSIFLAGINPFTRAEIILLSIIYLVIVPLLIVGCLRVPHEAMRKERDKILQPLADNFLKVMPPSTTRLIDNDDTDGLKKETDYLNEIKRQYDLLREIYPTWPLPVQTVRRLVAFSSLPVLTGIISLVVKLIAH